MSERLPRNGYEMIMLMHIPVGFTDGISGMERGDTAGRSVHPVNFKRCDPEESDRSALTAGKRVGLTHRIAGACPGLDHEMRRVNTFGPLLLG